MLSGLGLGFGAVILKTVKAVKIWGIPVEPGKSSRRLRMLGCPMFFVGLLLSLASIYKVFVGQRIICIALLLCLWGASLVTGSVCADFASSKYREYSENSFNMLGETDVLKTAEQKLISARAAVVGFDGIAFIDGDGSVSDVLCFGDFGLEPLKSRFETEALCQYLKSRRACREVHSVSDRLSAVVNVK